MKSLLNIYIRPDQFFHKYARKDYLFFSVLIWVAYYISSFVVFKFERLNKIIWQHDFLNTYSFPLTVMNEIFAMIVFLIAILFSLIVLKYKIQFFKLLSAILFTNIIGISFFPLYLLCILLKSELLYLVSFFMVSLWYFFLIIIALKTIYNVPGKRMVLMMTMTIFIFIFIGLFGKIICNPVLKDHNTVTMSYSEGDIFTFTSERIEGVLREGGRIPLYYKCEIVITNINLFIEKCKTVEWCETMVQHYLYGEILDELTIMDNVSIKQVKVDEFSEKVIFRSKEYMESLGIKINKMELIFQ